MTAKIIHDMSNEEYHSLSSISKSGLDLIRKAPALYKYRRENPQQPTPAMRLGTLVHTAILEPDRFDVEVCVPPKFDRRTTQGKADYAEFELDAAGKTLVDANEYNMIQGIRSAVFGHEAALKALDGVTDIEASLFWQDPIANVACRCRPDAVRDNDVIVDVKTTRDASPSGFAKSIAQYRYHVQAAYYMDGYRAATDREAKGFVFIAVETEAPYLVAVYQMSPLAIVRGRAEYQKDLATYKHCMTLDQWPGYSPGVSVIDLPAWA